MNHTLQKYSDQNLQENLKTLIQEERKITTEILNHLNEVERRQLHLKRGYSSLFEYVVKELGYSEGAAHRRIAASRLLKSLPELEAKKVESALTTGTMSLTTVSMVQDFVVQKKREFKETVSLEEKIELLQSIETKSKREVEKILIARAPELAIPKEKERALTEELTELKLVVNERVLKKLKRIKELRSHKSSGAGYSELIEDICDLVLKEIDPMEKPVPKKQSTEQKPKEIPTSPRYIPASIKQIIWKRDQGRCVYKDPITGKQCNSTQFVQLDHIHPVAKGGIASPENLQLLCSGHNRLKGINSHLEEKNSINQNNPVLI